MSHIPAFDRVLETTTTTGTGSLTTAGAVTGYIEISSITGIASGDTFYATTWGVDANGTPTGEWETGVYTFTDTNTVARTLITASSNAGAAVSFSAGTKYISLGINTVSYNYPVTQNVPRNVLSCDFTSVDKNLNGNGIVGASISTGTVTASPTTDANHPGTAVVQNVGANSGFYGVWGYNKDSGVQTIKTNGGTQFDIIFRTPGVITNITFRAGEIDTITTSDCVNGNYFEMPGSLAIVGKTANASTRTTSATIATLSASTWYHGRITINTANTSVKFEVFSEAGASLGSQTNTTNIPAVGGLINPGFVVTKSNTGTVDLMTLDFMSYDIGAFKPLARGRQY